MLKSAFATFPNLLNRTNLADGMSADAALTAGRMYERCTGRSLWTEFYSVGGVLSFLHHCHSVLLPRFWRTWLYGE